LDTHLPRDADASSLNYVVVLHRRTMSFSAGPCQ
jgi:hypothetical protein